MMAMQAAARLRRRLSLMLMVLSSVSSAMLAAASCAVSSCSAVADMGLKTKLPRPYSPGVSIPASQGSNS